MRTRRFPLTLSILFFAYCLLVAFTTANLTLSAKKSRQSKSNQTSVSITGASGLSIFQDIQVPTSSNPSYRADGTEALSEGQNHTGVPVMLGLGVARKLDGWILSSLFKGTMVRAISGPPETQSATYSRAHLEVGTRYIFDMAWDLELGGLIAGRRSSFNNVSTGHYVDSLLTTLVFGVKGNSFAIKGFAGAAPMANLYYNQGRGQGKKLTSSTTQLSEYGLESRLKLSPKAWFTLGVEAEQTNIVINDVMEYSKYGLDVFSFQSSKSIALTTYLFQIGFTKDF